MLASFRAEMLKLGKRPATWLLGGVWLAMLLTFAYLLPYFSQDSAAPGPGGGPLADTLPTNLVTNAVGGFALFGGALAMILARSSPAASTAGAASRRSSPSDPAGWRSSAVRWQPWPRFCSPSS